MHYRNQTCHNRGRSWGGGGQGRGGEDQRRHQPAHLRSQARVAGKVGQQGGKVDRSMQGCCLVCPVSRRHGATVDQEDKTDRKQQRVRLSRNFCTWLPPWSNHGGP